MHTVFSAIIDDKNARNISSYRESMYREIMRAQKSAVEKFQRNILRIFPLSKYTTILCGEEKDIYMLCTTARKI